MTKNTITKGDMTTTEVRYFISSLPLDVEAAAFAIRSHWMVESYHWHLDVTFREDSNHTLVQVAAYNLNIIKKMALNTLKPSSAPDGVIISISPKFTCASHMAVLLFFLYSSFLRRLT